MLDLFLWLIALVTGGDSNERGQPLPPEIPSEAKAMLKHHNARCGESLQPQPEVTAPPLRGSLRDRMQRERR